MQHIYLDESGDLGWKFSHPHRDGGSSRFLTLAYVIVPECDKHLLYRFVRRVYKQYKIDPNKEQKGTDYLDKQAKVIAQRMVKLLHEQLNISIGAITVKKENVNENIREDSNVLYNYMVSLSIAQQIAHFEEVTLIPDKRSIKVKSGNSLYEYLKIKIWFDWQANTKLYYTPKESHSDLNLIFVDWITNFIWRHYEDQRSDAYRILKPYLKENLLFF